MAWQFVSVWWKSETIWLTENLDNAIFTAKFTANLGPKIAGAVLPLGLPPSSLPALISGLASNNQTALPVVPGVTPQIIGAGVGGLFEAYNIGFRFVWIAAGCFTVIATVCKYHYCLFPMCRHWSSIETDQLIISQWLSFSLIQ